MRRAVLGSNISHTMPERRLKLYEEAGVFPPGSDGLCEVFRVLPRWVEHSGRH